MASWTPEVEVDEIPVGAEGDVEALAADADAGVQNGREEEGRSARVWDCCAQSLLGFSSCQQAVLTCACSLLQPVHQGVHDVRVLRLHPQEGAR